jgi:hypothetical protein
MTTEQDFQPLTGEIQVDGATSAVIPIALTDNHQVQQLRHLVLVLEPGAGVRLGADSQATLTIDENDTDWRGVLLVDEATLPFALRLSEAAGSSAALLKGQQFGFFPAAPVTAMVQLTPERFSALVEDVAFSAEATAFNTPVRLSLELSAVDGVNSQTVGPYELRGAATLRTEYPARSWLNTTNTGTFILLKQPLAPSTNEVQLVDLP